MKVVMNDNMVTQQKLTENERNTKYWIHKLDEKHLEAVHKKNILGSRSKRSKTIKNIESKDKILLYTSHRIKQRPSLSFVGYGFVESISDENKQYLGFDKSQRKIKLRGIKYFKEPVPIKDIADNLKFIKNRTNISDYLKSEYREISEEEFNGVVEKRRTTLNFPIYFERVSYTTEEFLLNSIKGLFNVIKMTGNSDHIEIKVFLKYLHKMVNSYGISKSYEDIGRFYSENAWKLGFEHTKSKDVDKLITLYDHHGNSISFAYIKVR
jgi:predicted RNA-binding protein